MSPFPEAEALLGIRELVTLRYIRSTGGILKSSRYSSRESSAVSVIILSLPVEYLIYDLVL